MGDVFDFHTTPMPVKATPERKFKRSRVLAISLVVLAVLGAGGYAAAYFAASDRIPKGTTVSGVDVGGQTRSEALVTLQSGLAKQVSGPIAVSVDGKRSYVTPQDAGLSVNYTASLEKVQTERSWSPTWLWQYYTGGEDVDAEVYINQQKMTQLVDNLAEDSAHPARDGDIKFDNGRFDVVEPRPGTRLDGDETRVALVSAYLGDGTIADLTSHKTDPVIDDAAVRAAIDTYANPAVSGPVVLQFGDKDVKLMPADYADFLAMVKRDNALAPKLDKNAFMDMIGDPSEGQADPVNASVKLVDGAPQIIPGQTGVTYARKDVIKAMMSVVFAPQGERVAKVKVAKEQPKFTTKDAKKLGVKEDVATFTTKFPFEAYRNINVAAAAAAIDGTIIRPGKSFSFNEVVGERSPANGFAVSVPADVVDHDASLGTSQVSTSLYNAALLAGMDITARTPLSTAVPFYPAGRDASVALGTDFAFENNTKHAVMIHAVATPASASGDGSVTVTLFSTKTWDVGLTVSGHYAVAPSPETTSTSPTCEAVTGTDGFQIDLTRSLSPAGSGTVDHSEEIHSEYQATPTRICEDPPVEQEGGLNGGNN